MEEQLSQISAVTNLAKELNPKDVDNLISYINPPSNLFLGVSDGVKFLTTLQNWKEFNPRMILKGIKDIRPDLLDTARTINWLSSIRKPQEPDTIAKSLIHILQIEPKEWMTIGTIIPAIKSDETMESKLNVLATEGYITRDLHRLVELMHAIQRDDIAIDLQQHQTSFQEMADQLFVTSFKREVSYILNDLKIWINRLRRYVKSNNVKVKQFLDDEEDVTIDSVFIPLTIIKEKPREVNFEDETTYNEIAFLRKIANKEIDIVPVDFSQELNNEESNGEIWCVLGNPGCGKTFLCHKTANDFGKGEFPQFSYNLVIPCRDENWHYMEKSRKKASINDEFIQNWLCLSMPIGVEWTADLAKHIYKTDGYGLLLIIDSMDEYTKEVSFEKTLLFHLLSRNCLTQSTILLTSRPGAYTFISSSHPLKIDRFFHVLGFSPEHRDLYFEIQLKEKGKLDQWKRLLNLHEEINQLSLVPVNASLFAALIRKSEDVTVHTLTHLYSELSAYLIRRQLSRMGLKSLAKKNTLLQLNKKVLECLCNIGEEAYRGVYARELTFSKEIQLSIDNVKKSCDCLGLAMEHVKKGGITRVWSFAHLTMQEFVGAFWLSAASWRDQCLSTRFIVQVDYFSTFRMVIRFLCGLLAKNPSHVLRILYKCLSKPPISMENIPTLHKFNCKHSSLSFHMGWTTFTEKFLQMSEILCESKSVELFKNFKKYIPDKCYFYFESPVTPNEWECFLRILKILESIQLIYFNTLHITSNQFKVLLTKLKTEEFSLTNLAIQFSTETGKCESNLSDYTNVIKESHLQTDTKISIELLKLNSDQSEVDQTETMDSESISCIFQLFPSNNLLCNKNFSQQCLKKIVDSKDFRCAEYLLISSHGTCLYYNVLFSNLHSVTQLNALHLYNIPTKFEENIQTQLSQLTNLQELTLMGENLNSLLPHISTLSDLKHLGLSSSQPTDSSYNNRMLELLTNNNNKLSSVRLSNSNPTEAIRSNEMLTTLRSCTNLVQIELIDFKLQPVDDTQWRKVMESLRSLLYLSLTRVPLNDVVMLSICKGLIHHPTIRYLEFDDTNLSSNSCNIIRYLIPTLLQNTKIALEISQLSNPDPNPINQLKQAAKMYDISLELK